MDGPKKVKPLLSGVITEFVIEPHKSEVSYLKLQNKEVEVLMLRQPGQKGKLVPGFIAVSYIGAGIVSIAGPPS